MFTTPIPRDPDNTAPVATAETITDAIGPMVRRHAAVRNAVREADGTVSFDAGRNLCFVARLNHNGAYDLQTFRAGELKDHLEDLSRDALGLAILTLCDRS